MPRHLLLTLESPMMSFGAETVDNFGYTHQFPTAAMLTGLLGNALGWQRTDTAALQSLQNRLVFASAVERAPAHGAPMTDFQTVQLGNNDRGWTTRGVPEGRAGGDRTYDAPHLRYREYYADSRLVVALRLEPSTGDVDVDDLAEALVHPARPLFIGRKHCLPSCRMLRGFADADSALDAVLAKVDSGGGASVLACWSDDDAPAVAGSGAIRSRRTADQRNWSSGLHGGSRLIHEGQVDLPRGVEHDHDC